MQLSNDGPSERNIFFINNYFFCAMGPGAGEAKKKGRGQKILKTPDSSESTGPQWYLPEARKLVFSVVLSIFGALNRQIRRRPDATI